MCSGFGFCLFLVDGSVVVDSLVICAIIDWGFVIGPCFAKHYLVAFQFSSCQGKNSWLLYFVVFLLLSVFSALCLFLILSLVGLQCVIVAFSGHTFLLFEVHYT